MSTAQQDLSPWFQAEYYRPTMVGPYQCRLREPYKAGKSEEQTIHFRWWDGFNWSHALPYDPDLDDEILAPPAELMIQAADEADLMIYLERFDWRGYNSDQDEL